MHTLYASWERICNALGFIRPNLSLCQTLLTRYAEPQRQYHQLQHLTECLNVFDTVRHLAQHPAEVAYALWFHDAIYDVYQHDNEERSAIWARDTLLEHTQNIDAATRVYHLIMATQHTAQPKLPDEQLLVDIDLAILAASQQRFTEYEQQIRAEYAFVPDDIFKTKRREILQGFLNRQSIYSTAYFKNTLEDKARHNLALAIKAL